MFPVVELKTDVFSPFSAFYVVIGDLAPEILGKFIDINANHVGSLR